MPEKNQYGRYNAKKGEAGIYNSSASFICTKNEGIWIASSAVFNAYKDINKKAPNCELDIVHTDKEMIDTVERKGLGGVSIRGKYWQDIPGIRNKGFYSWGRDYGLWF